MLLPPFWWGRRKNAPAGVRLHRLRRVLQCAQRIPSYQESLGDGEAGLPEKTSDAMELERCLESINPISWTEYTSRFHGRRPGWRQRPDHGETRSGLVLAYAQARAGLPDCRTTPPGSVELFSQWAHARSGSFDWDSDHAMAVFTGTDAGVLTTGHRNRLWEQYQAPMFEHFVGTDGLTVAVECEVHAGLHIRCEAAIVECLDGEIVLTSLTDEEAPAIRVQSGLTGSIDRRVCECGRSEPRLVGLSTIPAYQKLAVTA